MGLSAFSRRLGGVLHAFGGVSRGAGGRDDISWEESEKLEDVARWREQWSCGW